MSMCEICGVRRSRFRAVESGKKICIECARDTNERGKRLEKSLDKCFDYEHVSNKVECAASFKKSADREKIVIKLLCKKVWEDNFQEDFPDYKKYVSVMRAWKVDASSAVVVRCAIETNLG